MEGERLTITEAARRLKVSRPHVYNLIRRGQLTAIKNPLYRKGTWVKADEVAALLEQPPPAT
jgi:excisionase family DNA binding protein